MSVDLHEALRPWFTAYNEEIRSLAKEYATQPASTRDEWLNETCDGHEWVIYTFKARCVLIATDNPDAYEDEMGEPAPKVEAAAMMAIMADVRAAAGELPDEDEDDQADQAGEAVQS